MAQRARPTSPHLTVWRFTLTMTLSILHRILGVAMYFGTALLAIWLVAAAVSEGALENVQDLFSEPLGQIVLFGYSWALFHHMLGGLRYFTWDLGHGYEKHIREAMAWGNVGFSVLLTLLVWAVVVWF